MNKNKMRLINEVASTFLLVFILAAFILYMAQDRHDKQLRNIAACRANLRTIQKAQISWAHWHHLPSTAKPVWGDGKDYHGIRDYLPNQDIPTCPACGERYKLGATVVNPPRCTSGLKGHNL